MAQPRQHARYEPLYDVNPRTGVSIEVFFMDRTLETFGRCGAGWFWWPRRRGCSPDRAATGPFPTSYSAYRHAMNTALSRHIVICDHTSRLWNLSGTF